MTLEEVVNNLSADVYSFWDTIGNKVTTMEDYKWTRTDYPEQKNLLNAVNYIKENWKIYNLNEIYNTLYAKANELCAKGWGKGGLNALPAAEALTSWSAAASWINSYWSITQKPEK